MEASFSQSETQFSNALINAYNSQDIKSLSECLESTDERIKFEKWLVDTISSETGNGPTFAWHNKVITLLCQKNGKDEKESTLHRKEEDSLLKDIISKVGFRYLKNKNVIDKNIDSEGENFNFWQILAEIKDGILPATSEILLKIIKDRIIKDPEEFKSEIVKKDNEGMTPIHWVARINNTELMKFITENVELSGAFKAAMLIKDNKDNTPLHWAAYNNNFEMVKLIFGIAPEESKLSIIEKNQFGSTPVWNAAYENNMEMIKFLAGIAPEAFKISLLIGGSQSIPIHMAALRKNSEMIKLMAEREPSTLTYVENDSQTSVLDIVKMRRPHNYKDITRLYKQDPLLNVFREASREIKKRKAVSHSFSIPGTSKLVNIDTKEELRSISLEGHQPAEWFHMFSKDFNSFNKSYPDLINDDQKALLLESFVLAANSDSFSAEDKLKRIRDGLPTFINTGFSGHIVTLLIWGDQFIICNRGEASRCPLEIYHFNSANLDVGILKEIEEVKMESQEAYKKLFFKTLPEKLMFSKKGQDSELTLEALTLARQTMGNCSFVSPITAICAYFMLVKVRSVKEGRLLDIIPSNKTSQALLEAISLYRTWLGFQQLKILERLIEPLKNGASNFEPDLALIIEAIRKAYLILLDETGKKKLEEIVDKFINSIKIELQNDVKIDTLYWKTLVKLV